MAIIQSVVLLVKSFVMMYQAGSLVEIVVEFVPTHVTHDYPGGAAQPTVCELADNAAELAEKAAELRPMMASVTVSLVEAAALTTA